MIIMSHDALRLAQPQAGRTDRDRATPADGHRDLKLFAACGTTVTTGP